MISVNEADALKRITDLVVVQTLKHMGVENTMKTLSECRRTYGKDFINNAIATGRLTGTRIGSRTMYNVENIIALQALMEAEAQQQMAI